MSARSAENGFTPSLRSAEHGFTSSLRSAEHGFTSSLRSAEHGFTSSLRSAEHGFTLLETLVALSVLSIAALAMVRLDAFALRSASSLSATSMAQVVAGNAATDLLTDPAAPAVGTANETVRNGGQTWQVTRTVAALGDAGAMRIDILVRGGAGGQARLTVVRAAEGAAP